MKKKIMGMMFVLLFGTGQIVSAKSLLENSDIALSGTMDYYSSYMWRGQALDSDPVVQPGFTAGYKGLSVAFWSSMAVGEYQNAGISNEVDMTVSYSKSLGLIAVSLGHISYEFPGTGFAGTREVFLGVSVNELPFSCGLAYYNDYDDTDGVKGSFSILNLGKEVVSIADYPVNALLSYGSYGDYGTFLNGSVVTLGLSSSMALTEKISAAPSIYYVATSGDLADDAIGNQKGGIYGGVSLSF